MKYLCIFVIIFCTKRLGAQDINFVKNNFTKREYQISMRDGIKLYTIVYSPKDNTKPYPILMERTPYSAGPYGDTTYAQRIGPNPTLMTQQYIFVYQDVRGRYMSEGINLEVTPYIKNKKTNKDVDESSDTFDSIEWLLKNVTNNNGKVGIYGISYPGFYATASLPGAHPALKAVSPQAPVTDEFIGDDVNHNGAFFLMDNFNFINYYGKPRQGLVKDYGSLMFNNTSKDMYRFFLNLGPLSNTQSNSMFGNKSYIWNEYLAHDTYNNYWQQRNIREHLSNVTIPTLVVGGWFDAEDLYGVLNTYSSIEQKNKVNNNMLVMGPWTHGAWESTTWKQYASHDFGSNTSKFFQDSIEAPFFNYYLKGEGSFDKTEATIFETGSNQWKKYSTWPPLNGTRKVYYLNANQKLASVADESAQTFTSDPSKPVPYTNGIFATRNNDYMAEDQRFAANRPDVLVYETTVLDKDVTINGKITADLVVSMTGTDADFVVKIIDVLPEDEPNFKNAPRGFQMAGYQRLVRADVIRGKFRNSFSAPEAFVPDKKTAVSFDLNDVAHQFKKGHKIMVQVQCSWFPLVDRNPQQFLKISEAKASDYKKAEITVYSTSKITLPLSN